MDEIFFQDVINGNVGNYDEDNGIIENDNIDATTGVVKIASSSSSYNSSAKLEQEKLREIREVEEGIRELRKKRREDPSNALVYEAEEIQALGGLKKMKDELSKLRRNIHKQQEEEKAELKATITYQWPGRTTKLAEELWAQHKKEERNLTNGRGPLNIPRAVDSDMANGFRIAAEYGRDLIYVENMGWNSWTSRMWKRIPEETAVFNKIQGIEDRAREEIEFYRREVKGSGRYTPVEEEIVEEGLRNVIETLGTVRGLSNGLKMATHWAYLNKEELDNDDMVFNTVDGEVLLGTGEIRENRRESYCTKICPVGAREGKLDGWDQVPTEEAWDGWVACPLWMRFLEETFCGDKDLINYVWSLMGYCITGSVKEQMIWIFYGSGNNGKGVFLRTISWLMGEYYQTCPKGMIEKGPSADKKRDLSGLRWKRLIVDNELGKDSKLDENFVKAVTGGDKVSARGLYKDDEPYMPNFKIVCCTNNRPKIDIGDFAIWRRIRLVPFLNNIPKGNEDKDYELKLRMEGPGILEWLLIGAMRWSKNGLPYCKAVEEATNEYMDDEDGLSMWISETLEASGHEDYLYSKEMFEEYNKWARDNQYVVIANERFFGKEMKRVSRNNTVLAKAKAAKVDSGKVTCWRGVKKK